MQGTIDAPLSPGGYTQAQKLAEHLRLVPFTEAWTSPLAAAQEVRPFLCFCFLSSLFLLLFIYHPFTDLDPPDRVLKLERI